jgi:hypothetical protein
VGKPQVQGPPGRLRRRWEDYIKVVLKKSVRRAWTGLSWLRIGKKVAGCCESGDKPSATIKCEKFLEYLRND